MSLRPKRDVQCWWSKPGSVGEPFALVVVGLEYLYQVASQEQVEHAIGHHAGEIAEQVKEELVKTLSHLPHRTTQIFTRVKGRDMVQRTLAIAQEGGAPMDEAYWSAATG